MHSCHCQKWIFKISYSFYWRNIILFKSFYSYSQVFVFILSIFREKAGEGNGTPLQYSCLENPMDRGAWKAAVHGVAEDPAWLSNFTFTFHFHALEKEMATHSSVLAWRIPGMGEPGGLLPMGSHRVGHDWSDLAAAAEKKQLFNGFILFHISKWLFILLWDYFINIKKLFLKFGLATYFFQLTSSCHPQLEIYTLTRN